MPATRSRAGTSLSQAMILVAAVAVGLAWSKRLVYRKEMHRFDWPYDRNGYLSLFSVPRRYWIIAVEYLPCLAAVSIALTVMAMIQSRKRPARLARFPGVVACIAATTILIAGALQAGIETVRKIVIHDGQWEVHEHHHRFVWSEELIPAVSSGQVALGIAAAWTVLVLSRRWRIGPGWLDRAGLAIGLLWLVFGIVEAVAPWNFEPRISIRRLVQIKNQLLHPRD